MTTEYSDQDVLTAEETARYLRVSPATVYKRLALSPGVPERIPSISIGRRRVVAFWQLKAWMAQQAGVPLPPANRPIVSH